MAQGDYYVFCRRCSLKKLNTRCSYQPDLGWVCFNHNEIQDFSSNVNNPVEGPRPQIIRRPSTQLNFDNVAALYWGTTTQVWESLDCNWEDV